MFVGRPTRGRNAWALMPQLLRLKSARMTAPVAPRKPDPKAHADVIPAKAGIHWGFALQDGKNVSRRLSEPNGSPLDQLRC